MRIKNLRGGQWGPIKKKLDSFTLETSKNHLIRNFCAMGAWGLSENFLITVKPSDDVLFLLDAKNFFSASTNFKLWAYSESSITLFSRLWKIFEASRILKTEILIYFVLKPWLMFDHSILRIIFIRPINLNSSTLEAPPKIIIFAAPTVIRIT